MTRLVRLLAAALALCALLPAAALAKGQAPARVLVAVPKAGDISYAVAQVNLGKTAKARPVRGAKVFASKAGGVKVLAVSPAWAKLKKTTKAYIVVSSVGGGSSKLRNVAFIIARRAGGKQTAKGTITFTLPGAVANKKSFWVKKVGASGVADVYHATDAIATAVNNWSKYLTVLRVADAIRAALHPRDVHGAFRSLPRAKAAASSGAAPVLSYGGMKGTPLGKQLMALIYGTLTDRAAFQAAKRSPLAAQYIRTELNNPKLADRFAQLAAALPTEVPDQYAANAKEERRFGATAKASIRRNQVDIKDKFNASQQAAIEAPHLGADQVPGTRVSIQFRGAGTGSVAQTGASTFSCTSSCTKFFPSGSGLADGHGGENVSFRATADTGSVFDGWDGCTAGTGSDGHKEHAAITCSVKISAALNAPTNVIIGQFDKVTGSTPAPAPAPTPVGPTVAGTLDTSFGTNGRTMTAVGEGNGYGATGMARQSDGKILVVGTGGPTTNMATEVVRYLPNGKPDTSFGSGGVVTLPSFAGGDQFLGYGVAVTSDDRIVISGQVQIAAGDGMGGSQVDVGVVRLLSDGTLQTNFGGTADGLVRIPAGDAHNAVGQGLALDPANGNIYVTGWANDNGGLAIVLAALDPSGALRTGFGTGGVLLDQPSGTSPQGISVIVTAAGVVVSGESGSWTMLRRYTTAGAVDSTFNAGNPVVWPVSGATGGGNYAVAAQSDGRLLTAGYSYGAGSSCLVVQRTNTDGSADTGFGTGGTVKDCVGDYSAGEGLAVTGSGFYVTGHTSSSGQARPLLERYTAAGALDPTFGSGGRFVQAPFASGDAEGRNVFLDGANPVITGNVYDGNATGAAKGQFFVERIFG